MSVEKIMIVKRTIHVAQCEPCEYRVIKENNPPRETQCPTCKQWLRFEEESWTGKDI